MYVFLSPHEMYENVYNVGTDEKDISTIFACGLLVREKTLKKQARTFANTFSLGAGLFELYLHLGPCKTIHIQYAHETRIFIKGLKSLFLIPSRIREHFLCMEAFLWLDPCFKMTTQS